MKTTKFNIQKIIEDRVNWFFITYGSIPKKIPVSPTELHALEEALALATNTPLSHLCLCNRRDLQKSRSLLYEIGQHKILIVPIYDIEKIKNDIVIIKN